LAAIEFVDDKATRMPFETPGKVGPAIAGALLRQGVIGRAMPQGDILGFAPPFCLTENEAKRIVEATRTAVTEVLG
jgi:L-2,4-diaminobutyrate transaminase